MSNTRISSRIFSALQTSAVIFSSVCLLFVVTNLIAAWLLSANEPKGAEKYPPYMHEALELMYPDLRQAERDQLLRERMPGTMPEIFSQPREAPISGAYVNVHEHGFRIGANQGPWPLDDAFYNVFVFGSSTTFGYGVADDDTIPSYLQKQLVQRGLPKEPRIYNFARLAFYSTPERLLFSKLLALENVPDLAIFIDGMSEFFIQSEPAPWTIVSTRMVSEKIAHPWRTALRSLAMVRLLTRNAAPGALFARLEGIESRHAFAPLDDVVMHDRVIARYVANKRVAESLASAYGVDVAFVWQPIPTYKYDLRNHLFKGEFGHHQASGEGYPRMADFVRKRPMGENFLWCADIQEGVNEPLYVDSVHYSPRMSERFAGCIADLLVERRYLAPTLPASAD